MTIFGIMPTLHWWTGASSVSPYVITVAWGIASDIIIHHWSIAYELFTYWSLLSYFSIATITIATKLLLLLLPPLPLLPYYFATKHFAADIKSFTCGWIYSSTANTREYSLAPWCLLRNLLLVDVVRPPSAEVCRTVAIFPQVDDLRFINSREV